MNIHLSNDGKYYCGYNKENGNVYLINKNYADHITTIFRKDRIDNCYLDSGKNKLFNFVINNNSYTEDRKDNIISFNINEMIRYQLNFYYNGEKDILLSNENNGIEKDKICISCNWKGARTREKVRYNLQNLFNAKDNKNFAEMNLVYKKHNGEQIVTSWNSRRLCEVMKNRYRELSNNDQYEKLYNYIYNIICSKLNGKAKSYFTSNSISARRDRNIMINDIIKGILKYHKTEMFEGIGFKDKKRFTKETFYVHDLIFATKLLLPDMLNKNEYDLSREEIMQIIYDIQEKDRYQDYFDRQNYFNKQFEENLNKIREKYIDRQNSNDNKQIVIKKKNNKEKNIKRKLFLKDSEEESKNSESSESKSSSRNNLIGNIKISKKNKKIRTNFNRNKVNNLENEKKQQISESGGIN